MKGTKLVLAFLILSLLGIESTKGQVNILPVTNTNREKTYCDPDSNQIAVFIHVRFSGRCIVLGISEHPSSKSFPFFCNDCISSILVGANVQALLCSDANFKGRCEIFIASSERLSTHHVGNDALSSIRVVKRDAPIDLSPCTPNAGQVVLFSDTGFRGGCVVLERGEYPNYIAIGLLNDTASSVKVGANVVGILCNEVRGDGLFGCERYTADDADIQIGLDADDWLSSVKVRSR